jgi:hypothetical protein
VLIEVSAGTLIEVSAGTLCLSKSVLELCAYRSQCWNFVLIEVSAGAFIFES